MLAIEVIGIGLDGVAGLRESLRKILEAATVLVGSDRHLSYFPDSSATRIRLGNLAGAIAAIRQALNANERIVILVSGDPLFFGLGRLLLEEFPPEVLHFHPHFSSVQLAFNRLKVPWQDATMISAHGRSLDELIEAMQKGRDKIAVLTDHQNTPQAIATLYQSLALPTDYEFWVCENLGGVEEAISRFTATELLREASFSPLNVVVLLRQQKEDSHPIDLSRLPLLGIPDALFCSFRDRPGLMTKREIRLAILGELALQKEQIIWDIGAGTGSVSIEVARLSPTSHIYAIEKTAIGKRLIEKNCDRFQISNVTAIQGIAPDILAELPAPDRIFIGGSGGNLTAILDICQTVLRDQGILVLALATLEHLHLSLDWFRQSHWHTHLLQLQISHSVPIANLTRFAPLNPVTLITANRGRRDFNR